MSKYIIVIVSKFGNDVARIGFDDREESIVLFKSIQLLAYCSAVLIESKDELTTIIDERIGEENDI